MEDFSRRKFVLSGLGALGIGSLSACASGLKASKPFGWTEQERLQLAKGDKSFEILVRGANVLRRRARPVPDGLDLKKVSARMARAMTKAGGVGLAGPQVGLSLRIATLMLDYKTKHPRIIFVRNPVIVERSDDCQEGYEGCLSIPGVGGRVRRNKWIKIQHSTEQGELIHTEAEGANAVLWQHELDHLEGILYVDKLLGELMPMEKVRELRKLEDEKRDIPPQEISFFMEGSMWVPAPRAPMDLPRIAGPYFWGRD